jgi:hypothetical protein
MKRCSARFCALIRPFLVIFTGACLLGASGANAALLVGVTNDNTLIEFDSTNPGSLISGVAISGLAQNEVIRGIDFRPTDGQLYAVGSFSRIYTLDRTTGAASLMSVISVPLNGSAFGVDFNPAADFSGASSLRIVSNATQNLAVNADTGIATVATPVFYPSGGNANIVGEAYTNSVPGGIAGGVAGPPGTVQYAIDSGTDGLVLQAFNAGTLTPVGSLGVNTSASVGFDILAQGVGNNMGFATLDALGTQTSNLYSINLATGAAIDLGQIDGGILVPNLAAVPIPEPAAAALLAFGMFGYAFARRKLG